MTVCSCLPTLQAALAFSDRARLLASEVSFAAAQRSSSAFWAADEPIIGGTAGAMRGWFLRLYRDMGFAGMSSHSGRPTAITRWARKITEAGGSLKDVQVMAGHADLATTQGYIEVNKDAKRKVVNL